MIRTMTFAADEVTPDHAAVFEHQGIPAGAAVTGGIDSLLATALSLLSECTTPVGMLLGVSPTDFEAVYDGEGRNEPSTPVADIFHRAEELALFAVTLGERVSGEITERFKANDFALGCMLDSAASAATDRLAETVQRRFLVDLCGNGRTTPERAVLRYSPGYCGWHISGQKRLFELLHPERIGVSLGSSFLMQPLKSISGVMIAGRREIHDFRDSYPFCSQCETRGCRDRIRTLCARGELDDTHGG